MEEVIPVNDFVKTPICFGGERRCPPEDVGGVHGYVEFLEAILDPSHEKDAQYVRWAGGHFLDQFDVGAVNEALQRMRWPLRHRR